MVFSLLSPITRLIPHSLHQTLYPPMARKKSLKPKAQPVVEEKNTESLPSKPEAEESPVVVDAVVVEATPATSAAESNEKHDNVSQNEINGESGSDPKDPKVWGNLESMLIIEKSPYEPSSSAEIGEIIFDEMKSLLIYDSDNKLNPKASQLFGNRLAESLVQANYQIGKSGMLYSPGWQDGKIRGVMCGWIPKALLLLCLHEQRFTRNTEDAVLSGIIKDLGVAKIIGDAMQEWELEDDYMALTASLGGFTFSRQKLCCYKCAIFVARAYRCFKALKRKTVEDTLMGKIRRCLDIINSHIKVNKRKLAELQAEKEKKKEREMLKTRQSNDTTEESVESAATTAASAETVTAVENKSASAAPSSRGRKRVRQEREPSLNALLEMAEEQYKRMGETLATLRKRIQQQEEVTSETRESIREEIMKELGVEQPKKSSKKARN